MRHAIPGERFRDGTRSPDRWWPRLVRNGHIVYNTLIMRLLLSPQLPVINHPLDTEIHVALQNPFDTHRETPIALPTLFRSVTATDSRRLSPTSTHAEEPGKVLTRISHRPAQWTWQMISRQGVTTGKPWTALFGTIIEQVPVVESVTSTCPGLVRNPG